MTTNTQGARLSPLASGPARKFVLCLLTAFTLAMPAQAFAACISIVTRHYLFGYEVWRSETMECTTTS